MEKALCRVDNLHTQRRQYQWLTIEQQRGLETYSHILVTVAHIYNKEKLAKAKQEADAIEEKMTKKEGY